MAAIVRVQNGGALRGRPDRPDLAARRLMQRAARATLRHARREADWGEQRLFSVAEISITLLDDDEIARMNAEFLQHDGPTDVISFALYETGEVPVGDVYVGAEQAARQAAQAGVPLHEELARLAVHGVLHVLGHDHPDGSARLKSQMWQMQEQILATVLAT